METTQSNPEGPLLSREQSCAGSQGLQESRAALGHRARGRLQTPMAPTRSKLQQPACWRFLKDEEKPEKKAWRA